MNRKPAKPQTLVEEKLALDLFLQSLLREPQPQTEVEVQTEVEAPVSEPLAPAPAQTPVAKAPAPEVPVIEADRPVPETAPAPLEETARLEEDGEGLPPWADLFQAMLFQVAGLTLAVPLEELNGVVEFDAEQLTEMPGHADFFLGLMAHQGRSVPVVDTARLVFPPEKLQQLAGDDPLERVKRVVLIGDGRWGLACDEVDEVITLRRDEVRWRSNRTRRRWLLGTVIQHMCALVDTNAFARKLAEGSD